MSNTYPFKEGDKIYATECSWYTNYRTRFYVYTVKKITPTGKMRILETNKLVDLTKAHPYALYTDEVHKVRTRLAYENRVFNLIDSLEELNYQQIKGVLSVEQLNTLHEICKTVEEHLLNDSKADPKDDSRLRRFLGSVKECDELKEEMEKMNNEGLTK